MPGPVDEIRVVVLGTTERQFDTLTAEMGVEFESQSRDPISPLGAHDNFIESDTGALTGYSGGLTVTTGVYGISIYGGGDVYTAS